MKEILAEHFVRNTAGLITMEQQPIDIARKSFLAALNLELPMQDAPKDGSEILVKDKHDGWNLVKWDSLGLDKENSQKGWCIKCSMDSEYLEFTAIDNPQCWRPL